ncbi:MAG: hypothetical protein AAB900_02400, partial [Patescibacteria group bacterium]
MEKVKFELGREGKIISRSLGKIGFPRKGWSPKAGETYWVETEEKERVYIFFPATDHFALNPYSFPPQPRLDGEEFRVYEAHLRVS